MIDFTSNKIEIYQGINDIPIAPTNNKGGNISHLYVKFNQLINLIIQLQNELSQDITELANAIPNYDGEISTLQTFLNDLQSRIEILEGNIEPPPIEYLAIPENYIFSNLEITNNGLNYLFSTTGEINNILINNSSNIYDIYFELNGMILTAITFNEIAEGTEISFAESLIFNIDDTFKIYTGGNNQTNVNISFNLI